MTIHPETLKTLRTRLGLSQEALAEQSRVAKKTISRIESGQVRPDKVHLNTTNRLAKALGVTPEGLGKPQGPDDAILRKHGFKKLTVVFDSPTLLAYQLIEHRYQVPPHDLFTLAPLLFALLAEKSLEWRKETLDQIRDHAARLLSMKSDGGHLSFLGYMNDVESGVAGETNSINSADILGEKVSDITYEYGYDPSLTNPFVEFLRHFRSDLDESVISIDEDFGIGGGFSAHSYKVCRQEFDFITGGDRQAALTLEYGHVRTKDIPKELMASEKTEDRVKWIVSQGIDNELFNSHSVSSTLKNS